MLRPARVLGDRPGRRRRAADRRGARGRRRRLPAEVLRRVRATAREGRTIVLVTHDMAPSSATATGRSCSRAVASSSLAILVMSAAATCRSTSRTAMRSATPRTSARRASVAFELRMPRWSTAPASTHQPRPRQADRSISFTARRRRAPALAIQIVNADGSRWDTGLRRDRYPTEIAAGEEVTVSFRIDGRLASGHYYVHCGVGFEEVADRRVSQERAGFHRLRRRALLGMVDLEHESQDRKGARTEAAPSEPMSDSSRSNSARSTGRRRSAAAGGASATCSGSPR